MLPKSLLTSLLLTTATAHQNLHQLWINDVSPGPQTGIRMPPSNSPVEDVTSDNMACNVPSAFSSAVTTIDAAAGDTVKVKWDQSGHPGPITHFLKKVDSVATADGVGAGWFKIDEVDFVDGKWANEIMSASDMTHEFKLPAGLAGGEYLLRSEMLALHASQTLNGAQFYIGCVQLKVSGTETGTASCGPTISIPGAYKADDANVFIPNFYNGFEASGYEAPGGPVATCGAGGGSVTVPSPSTPANSTVPVASPVESASASASAVAVETPSPSASASPIASSTPTPAPAPSTGAGESGALPATFTVETFIAWLEGKAASKARRHARSFMLSA